jgi:hypothetical protein
MPWRPIGLWDAKDCPYNLFPDGGKIVSFTHRPRSTPQKHFSFSVSGIHICYRLSTPQGLVQLEGLGKLKLLIATRDLPTCSIVH